MKRTLFASLLGMGLVAFAAGSASAQDKAAPAKKPAAKPAAAAAEGTAGQRVKNYDFDADDITGELVKPEGEFIGGRIYAEHGSLIRVRADFIREIVKSAEDL